jgi:hypothetical protein
MKQILLVGGLLVILLAFVVFPSSAITVDGSKYMESIAPGSSGVHQIIVKSSANDTAQDVTVTVFGFGQGVDKSYAMLDTPKDTSAYSARGLITLDKNSFKLEPGTQQTVKATIAFPGNLGIGGRYALIQVKAVPAGGTSTYATAVLIPVMATVKDSLLTETGSITGVTFSPKGVSTQFKNTGNHHFYSAQNDVQVFNTAGQFVAGATSGPTPYAIIPGNEVSFVLEVKDLPAGDYTAVSKISLGDKKLDEKMERFSVDANKQIGPLSTSTKVSTKISTIATPTPLANGTKVNSTTLHTDEINLFGLILPGWVVAVLAFVITFGVILGLLYYRANYT